MRANAVQHGMLVRIRRPDGYTDANGGPLPTEPRRVVRIYTRGTYKTPWIELDGVDGQFRPSELEPA